MANYTDLILPAISAGGIIYIIVKAIIDKKAKRQEHDMRSEESLLDHLVRQNERMFEDVISHEKQTEAKLHDVESQLFGISERLESHVKVETAIDEALIASMRGHQPNGELTKAESLLLQSKGVFKFHVSNAG